MHHHRVEGVQLQLPLGHGPIHGHVHAEDREAALVDAFGDHRVHFGRHNRRSGLASRHVEIVETAARPGIEQSQIVGGLLQVHGEALDGSRRGHVRTHIRHGGHRIGRGGDWQPGDVRQMLDGGLAESQIRANAGTDGGGTEVELGQQRHHAIECSQIRLQQRGKRMKFLTIGHWYGVLQLRAANRHVIDMFVGQIVEGLGEFLGGLGERPDRVDKREFAGGRVGVVRGLRLVDVVVRMDVCVIAALVAGDFQRTVGDHLVHVHVRRGAGTALHHIDRELIGQFAGLDFQAGGANGLGLGRVDQA